MRYLSWFKFSVIYVSLLILLLVGGYSTIPAKEETIRPLDSAAGKTFFDRLRKVQEDIRTFKAVFVEERSIPSLKAPLHFEGELYYHHEGLFFMEYKKPIDYVMCVRGKEALFYVKGSHTADVADVSGVKGLAKSSDLFGMNPSRFKGQVWEGEKRYRLEEKEQGSGVENGGQNLTVFLNRKTFLVECIRIEDDYGDVTEITLSDIQVNREIPTFVLQFTLPKGVTRNRLDTP